MKSDLLADSSTMDSCQNPGRHESWSITSKALPKYLNLCFLGSSEKKRAAVGAWALQVDLNWGYLQPAIRIKFTVPMISD